MGLIRRTTLFYHSSVKCGTPPKGSARRSTSEVTSSQKAERGVYAVETALLVPVLFLVIFAAIFFCTLAAKNFALQAFATDIARDISLSLQSSGAIANCSTVTRPPSSPVDVGTFSSARFACWKNYAQSKYPVGITSNNLQISVQAFPIQNWFDSSFNPTTAAAPGDLFNVSVRYPASDFMGGRVAFLGSFNFQLEGTAVGFIERP
jgi:TadE-like protein